MCCFSFVKHSRLISVVRTNPPHTNHFYYPPSIKLSFHFLGSPTGACHVKETSTSCNARQAISNGTNCEDHGSAKVNVTLVSRILKHPTGKANPDWLLYPVLPRYYVLRMQPIACRTWASQFPIRGRQDGRAQGTLPLISRPNKVALRVGGVFVRRLRLRHGMGGGQVRWTSLNSLLQASLRASGTSRDILIPVKSTR